MFRGSHEIDAALTHLGKRLLYADSSPVSIIVCGGSALLVQGLSTRTTQDVDVCAAAAQPAEAPLGSTSVNLPNVFLEAVQATAREMGLNPLWLNTAAAEVLEVYGPPKGMEERLLSRDYGPCLRALFLSRIDQIHFKLLAAADPLAPERHLEDLVHRLRPSAVEARMAVDWLLDRPTSSWVRANIRQVVEALGHADIARDIPN
jgi:hypothetical protein